MAPNVRKTATPQLARRDRRAVQPANALEQSRIRPRSPRPCRLRRTQSPGLDFMFHGCAKRTSPEGALRGAFLRMLQGMPRASLDAVNDACDHSYAVDMERTRHASRVTVATYRNSSFCFVLPGDSPTSRRLFDSMAAGCTPIVMGDAVASARIESALCPTPRRPVSLWSRRNDRRPPSCPTCRSTRLWTGLSSFCLAVALRARRSEAHLDCFHGLAD